MTLPTGYRPLRDEALVDLEPDPHKVGSIHLPKNRREVHHRRPPVRYGTIVYLGPGRLNKSGDRVPMDCEVGQRVALVPWPEYGREVEMEDGTKLWLTSEDGILMEAPR